MKSAANVPLEEQHVTSLLAFDLSALYDENEVTALGDLVQLQRNKACVVCGEAVGLAQLRKLLQPWPDHSPTQNIRLNTGTGIVETSKSG